MPTKNTKVFGLVLLCFWVCFWQKGSKMGHKSLKKWPKHKKLFILAPERARTVLNAFFEWMYLASCTPVYDERFKYECQKFQKYTGIFKNVENSGIFLTFPGIFWYFGNIFARIGKAFTKAESRIKMTYFQTIFNRQKLTTFTIDFCEIAKIFGKRMALDYT